MKYAIDTNMSIMMMLTNKKHMNFTMIRMLKQRTLIMVYNCVPAFCIDSHTIEMNIYIS